MSFAAWRAGCFLIMDEGCLWVQDFSLEWLMTLGLAERQGDLLDDLNRFCEQALPTTSIGRVPAAV